MISSTPTNVTVKSISNLLFRRIWIFFQQEICLHYHSRRTETTLKGEIFLKRLLNWMKLRIY
ncbi:Carbon monoxide dehydrogenase, small chain. Carboxy-end fragment (cutC-2) [Saccharolobus solfataricus P2]|uniref:Carbon monoxide dehydrogenase, small chain. Carboxy-end (CutC-2) n=1 Tax=Saccharolobus solfataricus (strain ATCC 35092 / DSM 1617 / JCM 11322 / P2) TaxID=273057 RepID=Q97VI5_SACS2|nr:Carbon monoxide dehydrogenase, small chain. Carboxy-end fragment (cutC-2) [Saccharolobus solfataricus P2]